VPGVTRVARAGDFYILQQASDTLFVYQDSNRDGVIAAGEFGIRMIGLPGVFSASEFSLDLGHLVYVS